MNRSEGYQMPRSQVATLPGLSKHSDRSEYDGPKPRGQVLHKTIQSLWQQVGERSKLYLFRDIGEKMMRIRNLLCDVFAARASTSCKPFNCLTI
jgi:hypothetical protein